MIYIHTGYVQKLLSEKFAHNASCSWGRNIVHTDLSAGCHDPNVTFRKKVVAPNSHIPNISVEDLRCLRNEVSLLKEQLSKAVTLVESYETKLDFYSNQIADLHSLLMSSTAPNLPTQGSPTNKAAMASVQTSKPKKKSSRLNAVTGPKSNPPQKASNPPQKACSDKAELVETIEATPSHPISEQHQWREVRQNRRPPSLCGAAGPNVTSLKAVEPRKYLHLWNMESSADEIRDYLRHLCPVGNCTVEELRPRGDYKSYKLGVPVAYFDSCLSTEVWPVNARIKTWIAQKRKQAESGVMRSNQPFRDQNNKE
ncbi:unnamed protein product [Colias eurytheme]|nr:unnamed protein product [Colias eurytheme]